MKKLGILTAGIFKENPVFVLMLGLCPTLGVTSSAINGFSMGLAVIAVLACSNGLISLFKKFIPDEVRIPAFIMIIATLVTVVDMVMNAYTPDLYKVLGLFIPLIVVKLYSSWKSRKLLLLKTELLILYLMVLDLE